MVPQGPAVSRRAGPVPGDRREKAEEGALTRSYPVLGHSMRFLLEPGDLAEASPCRPEELGAGELALLVKWAEGRPAGYVIHRVIFNYSVFGRRLLLTRGDANFLPDLPARSFQPVARITSFARGGQRWPAQVSRFWPVSTALSFFAGKAAAWTVAAVFFLFAASVRLLPRQVSSVLDRLYLGWESFLYPLLLRMFREAFLPPGGFAGAAPPAEIRSGRITGQETWSGRVAVADYLSIEKGASVTVMPGTEIIFERKEPWFFPVARAGIDGSLRELDSSSAKILVYGSIRVNGSPEAPVIFRGPSFGGVRLLSGAEGSFSDCRFEGSSACALGSGDDARLLISDSRFLDCRSGIEGTGRSSLEVRGCSISNSGGVAVRALDLSSLSLDRSIVTGCSGPGLEASGLSSAFISGTTITGCSAGIDASGEAAVAAVACRLEGCVGHALQAAGRARFSAARTVFTGNAAGLRADGASILNLNDCSFEGQEGPAGILSGESASFERCAFEGNGAGLEGLSAELRLKDCSFTDQSGPAVLFSGGFIGISGSSFVRNASGVKAEGKGRMRLQDCSFEEQAGPGASLSGARGEISRCSFLANASGIEAEKDSLLSVEACSFTGHAGPGASFSGGTAVISGCSFSRNSAGAEGKRTARIRFRSCSFDDHSGPAASFSGGSADIEGSSFGGNAAGLSFFGGCRGSVRDCVFRAGRAAALQAREGSRLLVSDCSLAGGPSALLLDGASASLRNVRMDGIPFPGVVRGQHDSLEVEGVTYAGRPWRIPGGPSARPGGRRFLFSFVAATAALPVFSSLYRVFYLAATRAASLLLPPAGVSSLYLYRGMAAGGWVPGLSDMDLACLIRPSGPDEDRRTWSALRRRVSLLKRLFPFTGEVMAATEGEFSAFLSEWGVKGEEFAGASVLLSGEPLRPRPRGDLSSLADRTEAFYAYTLLMRHFYSEGLPAPFVRRNCLKNMADVKRYLCPSSPLRLSRAAFARETGTPLQDFMAVSPEGSAYGAFRALHEASVCASGETAADDGAARSAGAWFDRENFEAARRELSEAAGLECGLALDALYRVYFVVPDHVAEDMPAFLRACAALRTMKASSVMLTASPLVLTRRAFSMLAGLPYLNNPCFGFELAEGSGKAGLTPEDGGICLSGLGHRPGTADPESLRSSAKLAGRHFCASWRSLWGEMPAHYFYTRALGLPAVLRDGSPIAFSSPEAVHCAFAASDSPDVPGWIEYSAGGRGEANYRFIAQRTALLGRLCDAP